MRLITVMDPCIVRFLQILVRTFLKVTRAQLRLCTTKLLLLLGPPRSLRQL